MRNHIATSIAVGILLVLVFGLECSAQVSSRVISDIPFDFYVGSQKMPSGKYEFESTSGHVNPGSMIVRSLNKAAQPPIIVSMLFSQLTQPDVPSAITFNRYGSTHYLSKITLGSSGYALKMARTSAEKASAKNSPEEARVTIGPSTPSGN